MKDNRLAFLDQTTFIRLRATGAQSVGQCTWVYDGPVDMDGLRRFNESLGRGLLGRRIERSPLPFGRDRWVAHQQPPDIDIAEAPRPRTDIGAWTDERGLIPVDPEYGPSWHLGVLPLMDGGTAVTLVASHAVVDGLGLGNSIREAVNGEARQLGYPPSQSRGRARALFVDGRDTVRGLPDVLSALITCIVILLKRSVEFVRLMFGDFRNGNRSASLPLPTPQAGCNDVHDDPIVLPSATIRFDLAAWDVRAAELGGTSNSLFIAFAAKLAQRIRRVSSTDGAVTISVLVSERTQDDTRGNALTEVSFRIDPTFVTTDLEFIRKETKQRLAGLQDSSNELLKLLPLMPFLPKWIIRNVAGSALRGSDFPVCCSNLGNLDPALTRVDGFEADFYAREFTHGATRRRAEQAYGKLFLISGRVNEKIFISVDAYQPGADNSKKFLRGMLDQTLSDFRLKSEVEI